MLARSSIRLIGASIALVAAVVATFAFWPGTSGASVVPQARAELVNSAGISLGSVTFLGHGGHATQVRVELAVPQTGVALNDFHGLHVHATGICDPNLASNPPAPFISAGPHWDGAGGHTHGAHLGDLPSVLIGSDGTASLTSDIARFDVDQIAGRAVILHAGRDNFGNVPTSGANGYTPNSSGATTLTEGTGNAGLRYGCGVIEAVGNS
jgi:superoxide dismutase, Cu-Zn family